jgi:hypothetical protein
LESVSWRMAFRIFSRSHHSPQTQLQRARSFHEVSAHNIGAESDHKVGLSHCTLMS